MELRILGFFIVFTLTVSSPLERRQEGQGELRERLKRLQDSLEVGRDPRAQHEYARYWKELISNNPALAKQFQDMSPEDIAQRFGDNFAHKEGNIRSQIDELQRLNLEKMKNINGNGGRNQDFRINRGPYIDPTDTRGDHRRPTADEISKRMGEHRKIQEELDRIRRDEFKHFEERIEDVRRKKLKEMNEAQRLIEERRLEELAKKHRDHEKMQHPASKQQLEDVWQNQDGLGDENFNPKTFFYLHDQNSDGFWDIYELEALFMNEIKKAYKEDENNDMMMREELAEMREHVFGEVDRDRDGLISLSEFLNYSDKEIFNVDEEWKTLEERDKFVLPEDFDGYDYDYEETKSQQEQLNLSPEDQHFPDSHATESQNPDSHTTENQNPDSHAIENQNPDSHTTENQNPDSHTTENQNPDSHTNPNSHTAEKQDSDSHNQDNPMPDSQVVNAQDQPSAVPPVPDHQSKHEDGPHIAAGNPDSPQESDEKDSPKVIGDDMRVQQGNL